MSVPPQPLQISPDGKYYWDGQHWVPVWVPVRQPPPLSLNAQDLPANQRGRLTPGQALPIVLKETGKALGLVLSPASALLPLLIVLVPLAIVLTPVFVIAATVECMMTLRREEGTIHLAIKRGLLFAEYRVTVGDRVLAVPRRVHDGLVDGADYRLYTTPLSNVLVNYEKLS